MPLVSDVQSKPVLHSNLQALGFWMSIQGRTPFQPVRIFVTYDALAELDPTNVGDLYTALENFDRLRGQIEAAPSRKFDRLGPDADKYEGLPGILITTDDLT